TFATSSVPTNTESERPSPATKDRRVDTSRCASTLTLSMRSPLDSRRDLSRSSHLSCSTQAGAAVVQKLRNANAPPNDLSSQLLPVRSGSEKSGARNGSINQVSTDVGRVSLGREGPARA